MSGFQLGASGMLYIPVGVPTVVIKASHFLACVILNLTNYISRISTSDVKVRFERVLHEPRVLVCAALVAYSALCSQREHVLSCFTLSFLCLCCEGASDSVLCFNLDFFWSHLCDNWSLTSILCSFAPSALHAVRLSLFSLLLVNLYKRIKVNPTGRL